MQSPSSNNSDDFSSAAVPPLPPPPVLERKISYRPEKVARLLTCELDELEAICIESNINIESYQQLNLEEKKQILLNLLIATYPPEHKREYYEKIQKYKLKGIENFNKQDNDEINELFSLLLTKLGVEQPLDKKLMKSFTILEKFQHLMNSICVLDDDPNFMEEDEEMITIMDSDRFIDSIRLLTCKYRIMNSSQEWLRNFCTSGGISVLVENMDNRLDKDPMEITDAAALLQLIYCIKHIMQTDGLKVAIATRGAIDGFCMSLRFQYPKLALEVLEILAVVCTYGGKEGVTQTVMGLIHLARTRNEKPFEILVDAMKLRNPMMKVKVMALVNAILNVQIDLADRLSYRNDLQAVKFDMVIDSVLKAPKDEPSAKEKVEKLRRASGTVRFQAGMEIASEDLEKMESSEFGTVDPANGVMSGICWETADNYVGVEKRLCEVKDGIFSWYNLQEKTANPDCQPLGSQNMASVVEIMGYSTSHTLQRMFKYCFVFQCSDGKRYQYGVDSQQAKNRWMVALQVSMAKASQKRTAYTISKRTLTKEESQKAHETFENEVETYRGIQLVDKKLMLEVGQEGLISAGLMATFVQQELALRDPHLKKRYLTELAKLLLQNDPEHVVNCFEKINSGVIPERRTLDVESSITAPSNPELQSQISRLTNPPKKTSMWVAALASMKSADVKPQTDKKALFSAGKSVKFNTISATAQEPSEAPVSESDAMKKVSSATTENSPEPPLKSEKSDVSSAEKSNEDAPESTGVGARAALNGLFGGRGRGRGPASNEDTPEGTGVGARAALNGLFGGRGGPGRGMVPQAESTSVGPRLAVISSRPIPVPPRLPGSQAQPSSGDIPPLPGFEEVQPDLPAKPKITPRVKMRQLHWILLNPPQIPRTVWNGIEEPPYETFSSVLEANFGVVVTTRDNNPTTPVEESKSAPIRQKPRKICLFDGNRTQNIAIVIGNIPLDTIVPLITELNPFTLSAELAQKFLTACPKVDEINTIREYNGPDELDDICSLMSRLSDIPRLQQRLETHRTTLTWEDSANILETNLTDLERAISEITSEACLSPFKRLLSIVLAVGNYVNGGTSKGQAYGIKLSGLLKMADYRGKSGSKDETLLHQVIQFYRRLYSDEFFYSNWKYVDQVKSLSLEQLKADLTVLQKLLEGVENELKESEKIVEAALRDPLQRNCRAFLEVAQQKQTKNTELLTNIQKSIKDLRQFFGEPPESGGGEDPAQSFFKLLLEFTEQCKKAVLDLDVQAEMERRQRPLLTTLDSVEIPDLTQESIDPSPSTRLLDRQETMNLEPMNQLSAVDIFSKYQVHQSKSSGDRISEFLKGAINTVRRAVKGRSRKSVVQEDGTIATKVGFDHDDEEEEEEESDVEDHEWTE